MSALSKIREKSSLLLIVIGGALVAFIFGELLTSNRSFFSSGTDIGEIAGEPISYKEFENRLLKEEEKYRLNSGATTIDENVREQLRSQVWNNLINEYVAERQYQELGLAVSSLELHDMVRGEDPHPSVKQAFSDPNTGGFDAARIQQYIQSMEQDPTGAAKTRWLIFESSLKKEKIAEKYNNLVSQGLYVTNLQAKHNYVSRGKSLKLNYVVKRYSTLADSLVKFDESDLKKYYSEHLNNYEQEASRGIEYVTFDILPSEEDLMQAKEQAGRLAKEFKEADNDSLFVSLNSDVDLGMDYKTKEQLSNSGSEFDKLYQDSLFTAGKGALFGPVKENGFFKIGKLVDYKFSPDSVKARHILVKINNNDTARAMFKVDSLKRLISKGAKFAEIAEKNSEDPGSGAKGGDLGWFTEGRMVKPFSDASFNGKKGDMPVVVSQFGVHLIEIQDKSSESKKVQIAYVQLNIEPSSTTFHGVYAKASAFANENNTAEKFAKAILDQNLNKRIADNVKEADKSIAGLENARELVRWMYTGEEGVVSKAFDFDNKYVVAYLKEVNEKGNKPFEKVKEEIGQYVIKEKKAQKFIEEMNTAGVSDLGSLASKLNLPVDSADNISFSAVAIPGAGREPFVIGSAFGLAKEQISAPLEGETGVFVLKVINISEPQPIEDYSGQKLQLGSNYKSRVNYEAFEILKEMADIVDDRGKFY